MEQYADYDFYASEYGNDIPHSAFCKYAKEASAYIRRLTLKRSDGFTGEELKYATCAVAEAYYTFDKSCVNGKVIASENNDGYSVTYVNSGNPFKQRMSAGYFAAKKWLSGTGLLSRKVSQC